MQRRKLLDWIAEYAATFPSEEVVVDRFRSFVEAHERCFERDLWAGHITGSAWVVDPQESRVLLTHHKKLDIWVQLGGHDGVIARLGVLYRMTVASVNDTSD